MKLSVIGKRKGSASVGSAETLVNMEFSSFIEKMKSDTREGYILRYRSVYAGMDHPENWVHIDRIPRVCVSSFYGKTKEGVRAWRGYTGITVLNVVGLNNVLEVEKVKHQASMFPQTLCAFVNADGRSVSVWTLAQLPDGTLPKTEKAAELFCVQAYVTSVMCYTPTLEFDIEVTEPSLDKKILMTVDDKPYVNPHPTAFIIEQPTEQTLKKMADQKVPSRFDHLEAGPDAYVTLTDLFNSIYRRVSDGIQGWRPADRPMQMVSRVADACAEIGFPEEEATQRLLFYFYKQRESEIRSTVNNIYRNYGERSMSLRVMPKHQMVAFKLREFMKRRYDIRFNEVLQMTEFRPKRSLFFMYRELDRRELNTIHHEACLEGIEPTFSEVDELVHSTYVKKYNPIDAYLDELPKWDGTDRICALAEMVPTETPNWVRLFRQWFLSMVAHWMNGDTVHANATAPILIGAQGYRKSTFCRMILPPELQKFFTDSIDFTSDKDAQRCLSRFLLVNIDEFDQLSEKQFAFVKHLFQKPVTNIRRMYSETIGTQRRYASFIGTSNMKEVLRDPTGNRRYICVEVNAPIRTENAINYAQLYAQAKNLILKGERYWLNDEDEALIRESNANFEVETPLEQLVLSTFELPENEDDGTWMSSTDILKVLMHQPTFDKKRDNNPFKLGKVLKKLGFERGRRNYGVVYWVKRRGE